MARTATVLAVFLLAFPAAAAARLRTIAPPGNPTVSQYLETVPTDRGQTPTSSPAQQAGALTPAQQRSLNHRGVDGRTLVAVVAATSPPSATASGVGVGRPSAAPGVGAGLASAAPSSQGARSPAASILAAAGGSGGIGILLPAVMIAVVLGALLGVAVRGRRSPPS